MDKVDVRIIRECLQGAPYTSIWPARAQAKPAILMLSKKLSMAESTVRERYERLSDFLSGWTLMLNPSLMHVKMGALCWLDVPERVSKQDVLEKLKLVDDVMIIVNYSSRNLACIIMCYDDEVSVKRKVRLIEGISGCKKCVYTDIPSPVCDAKLSLTDLRIVSSLQSDMAKSNRDVAKELSVSARTVKRRLARLVREGAVWPVASLNVGALKDVVYADLLVVCEPNSRAKTEAEVLSIVDDFLIFNGRFDSLTEFNLMLPSVPTARTILDRVNKLHGVEKARIDFVEERFEAYEIVGEQVKRMITQMAAQ